MSKIRFLLMLTLKGFLVVWFFFNVAFWCHSREHTLLPNLVIFKFENLEMLREGVILSGFIPPLL